MRLRITRIIGSIEEAQDVNRREVLHSRRAGVPGGARAPAEPRRRHLYEEGDLFDVVATLNGVGEGP